MSLSGNLQETPLPEVLRRLEGEGRSGTLRLARGALRARIGLRHGRPISVRAPGLKRLGDLLVSAGLADPITVQAAARIQAEERGRRPLGQILVGNGVLAAESLERMVRQQLEQALADLANWPAGRFEFAADEPAVPDDLSLDLAATSSTPAIDAAPPESTSPASTLPGVSGSRLTRSAAGPAETLSAQLGDSPHQVEVLSSDRAFAERLALRLATPGRPFPRPTAEAPGWLAPGRLLLVVDLRASEPQPADLAELRRLYPGAPILAVQEPGADGSAAYAAGAMAVVPPDPEVVLAAASTWIEVAAEEPLAELAAMESVELLPGRVFGELAPGSSGATVALDLMQAIAQGAERAVLFLARHRSLAAAGAFGAREDGRHLAELTRGLRLDLEAEPALAARLEREGSQVFDFDGGDLPAAFTRLVGRPRSGEAVLLPVPGGESLVAVIYADNGPLAQGIDDLSRLALAAARFGPPLETELLIGEAARTLG